MINFKKSFEYIKEKLLKNNNLIPIKEPRDRPEPLPLPDYIRIDVGSMSLKPPKTTILRMWVLNSRRVSNVREWDPLDLMDATEILALCREAEALLRSDFTEGTFAAFNLIFKRRGLFHSRLFEKLGIRDKDYLDGVITVNALKEKFLCFLALK